MKKKILIIFLALSTVTISLLLFLRLPDTALLVLNTEALSQSEGTAVKTCYIKG